jgi:hypothetical protein
MSAVGRIGSSNYKVLLKADHGDVSHDKHFRPQISARLYKIGSVIPIKAPDGSTVHDKVDHATMAAMIAKYEDLPLQEEHGTGAIGSMKLHIGKDGYVMMEALGYNASQIGDRAYKVRHSLQNRMYGGVSINYDVRWSRDAQTGKYAVADRILLEGSLVGTPRFADSLIGSAKCAAEHKANGSDISLSRATGDRSATGGSTRASMSVPAEAAQATVPVATGTIPVTPAAGAIPPATMTIDGADDAALTAARLAAVAELASNVDATKADMSDMDADETVPSAAIPEGAEDPSGTAAGNEGQDDHNENIMRMIEDGAARTDERLRGIDSSVETMRSEMRAQHSLFEQLTDLAKTALDMAKTRKRSRSTVEVEDEAMSAVEIPASVTIGAAAEAAAKTVAVTRARATTTPAVTATTPRKATVPAMRSGSSGEPAAKRGRAERTMPLGSATASAGAEMPPPAPPVVAPNVDTIPDTEAWRTIRGSIGDTNTKALLMSKGQTSLLSVAMGGDYRHLQFAPRKNNTRPMGYHG